jgi:hypothetical protein
MRERESWVGEGKVNVKGREEKDEGEGELGRRGSNVYTFSVHTSI